MTFKWADAIEEALRTGEFSQQAKELAEQWISCAVGEQNLPESLRRFWAGAVIWKPIDERLAELGYSFNDAVWSNQAEAAKAIFAEIVERSAMLKAAELKQREEEQ